MWTFVLTVLLVFWVLPKFFVRFVIPKWAWQTLGVFMLIMIIYNAEAVYKTVIIEAKAWFPVVQTGFQNIMNGMRDFIQLVGRSGS